jgi:hypothetical protein
MNNGSTNSSKNLIEKAMQALQVAQKLQRDKLSLGADYVNVEGGDDNWLQTRGEEEDLLNETNNEFPPMAREENFSYIPLTSQQQQEAIARVASWVQNHPDAVAVRTQYLTLVGTQGTLEQQQEAIRQTASWLASHLEASAVWEKYLILIGKVGTRQQQQEALAQTINWLQSHPQDVYVREQYLALVGKVGTGQQQQEAIVQTAMWLESHPEDRYVREQYLALVGKVGTREQQQRAVAETTIWLRSHPQDRYVREQYLTLIGKLGSTSTSESEPTRRINLRQLQQVLGSIGDAVDTLLGATPQAMLAFRSTTTDGWQKNMPSQGITLDGQTVLLTIESRPEEEDKISIRVQLEPTSDEIYLPEGLKLILITLSEVYEDQAGSDRELIEAVIPEFETGESFTIQVALSDASFTQDFEV